MKKFVLAIALLSLAAGCARLEPRAEWVAILDKVARPVIDNAAAGTLKSAMPYESPDTSGKRRSYSYLEALGRTVCGIAPWLENEDIANPKELRLQEEYRHKCRQALSNAVNPQNPDYMNFVNGSQPLVDAAYLAEGILRAPVQLWEHLPDSDQANLIAALKATRRIKPYESNWLLFASQVEATLLEFTGECDTARLVYGVERFRDSFYKGDGLYGDGAAFHMDYYNSYVIHPMLLDVLAVMQSHGIKGFEFIDTERVRHTRYSAILERMISPEGAYPVLGRSITACRTGVFHCLAQDALLGTLPEDLEPSGVRAALTAVIRRQLDRKDGFDPDGWLKVGFVGSQPQMAEKYVNTGSLYHCLTVFLPLGLPSDHPFWSGPDRPWTSVKAWNGDYLEGDHAIKD